MESTGALCATSSLDDAIVLPGALLFQRVFFSSFLQLARLFQEYRRPTRERDALSLSLSLVSSAYRAVAVALCASRASVGREWPCLAGLVGTLGEKSPWGHSSTRCSSDSSLGVLSNPAFHLSRCAARSRPSRALAPVSSPSSKASVTSHGRVQSSLRF